MVSVPPIRRRPRKKGLSHRIILLPEISSSIAEADYSIDRFMELPVVVAEQSESRLSRWFIKSVKRWNQTSRDLIDILGQFELTHTEEEISAAWSSTKDGRELQGQFHLKINRIVAAIDKRFSGSSIRISREIAVELAELKRVADFYDSKRAKAEQKAT
tara:strand:+ start:1990 stop:2466 length:477 start_codon:yes stop_codon:yes gene_type:complete